MDPLEKEMFDGPKRFTYVSSLLSNEEGEYVTPGSGPTRLADPNRSPRHDTIYTIYYTVLGLSLTCSFLELTPVPVVYKQFL